MLTRPGLLLLGILLGASVLGGCTSSKQTYSGFSYEAVWTAMKAVAENPSYPDWKIAANDVWISDPAHRIEIYRHLRRIIHRPDQPPHREEQQWRFEVTLVEVNPPTARIVSRGFQLPTNAQAEVSRYFNEVHDMLIGLPSEQVDYHADDDLDALGLDEAMPITDEVIAVDDEPTGDAQPSPPPEVDFLDPD